MISPLGPRGQQGVSKSLASASLAPLAIMLQYKTEGWCKASEAVRYSETLGMIWVAKK